MYCLIPESYHATNASLTQLISEYLNTDVIRLSYYQKHENENENINSKSLMFNKPLKFNREDNESKLIKSLGIEAIDTKISWESIRKERAFVVTLAHKVNYQPFNINQSTYTSKLCPALSKSNNIDNENINEPSMDGFIIKAISTQNDEKQAFEPFLKSSTKEYLCMKCDIYSKIKEYG